MMPHRMDDRTASFRLHPKMGQCALDNHFEIRNGQTETTQFNNRVRGITISRHPTPPLDCTQFSCVIRHKCFFT
jgi:hypothetical protein